MAAHSTRQCDRQHDDERSGQYQVQQRSRGIDSQAMQELVADCNVTEDDSVNDEQKTVEADAGGDPGTSQTNRAPEIDQSSRPEKLRKSWR